jgi:hypothetical protein
MPIKPLKYPQTLGVFVILKGFLTIYFEIKEKEKFELLRDVPLFSNYKFDPVTIMTISRGNKPYIRPHK